VTDVIATEYELASESRPGWVLIRKFLERNLGVAGKITFIGFLEPDSDGRFCALTDLTASPVDEAISSVREALYRDTLVVMSVPKTSDLTDLVEKYVERAAAPCDVEGGLLDGCFRIPDLKSLLQRFPSLLVANADGEPVYWIRPREE
jgi:hypothetical protein